MPAPMKAPRRTRHAMHRPQFTFGLPPSYPRPPSSLLHDSVSATRPENPSMLLEPAAANISPFDWEWCGFDRSTPIPSSDIRALTCRKVQGWVDFVDSAPPRLGRSARFRLVNPFSGTITRFAPVAVAAAVARAMNMNDRVRVEWSTLLRGANRIRCQVKLGASPARDVAR